jgi:RNA polymerase sigma factor (sigma-70 family)
MLTESRNALFMQHQNLIYAAIARNRPLLTALRLETEDVAQDLAVSLMSAIEKFDPERSDSMATFLSYKLKYAILDMRRRHKPHGVTKLGPDERLQFLSVENIDLEIPSYDTEEEMRVIPAQYYIKRSA